MGFSANATQADIWWINTAHIIERTGWTIEYIEALPLGKLAALTSVWAGEAKAQNKG